MSYIGKKSLYIQKDKIANKGNLGVIEKDNISDAFRREIGNFFVSQDGEEIQFQTLYGQDTWMENATGILGVNPPQVKIVKIAEDNGEYIHQVEVSTGNTRFQPNTGVTPDMGSVYDFLEQNQVTEDVDGLAVEYDPNLVGTGNSGLPHSGIIFQNPSVTENPVGSSITPEGSIFVVGQPRFQGLELPNTFDRSAGITGIMPTADDVPQIQIQEIETSSLQVIQESVEIASQRDYVDFNINIDKPFRGDELEQMSFSNNPLWVDVESGYVFYNEQYENKYYNNQMSENRVPNMYSVLADDVNMVSKEFIDTVVNDSDNIYGTTRNIAFVNNSNSDTAWLNNLVKNAFAFPAYVDIQMRTEPSSVVGDLKEAKLNNTLMIDYFRNLMEDNIVEVSFVEQVKTIIENEQIKNKETTLDAFRFMDWLRDKINLNDGLKDEFVVNNVTDITLFDIDGENVKLVKNLEEYNLTSLSDSLFALLAVANFQKKLSDYIKQYSRGYDDIFAGETAPSETLFYTIDKVEFRTGRRVQKFLFLNDNVQDLIKYVDTQVKYEVGYRYDISAHKLVFATRYQYQNVRPFSVERNSVLFDVSCKPELLLVTVPYHTEVTVISDAPPTMPEIEIVPYRDHNDAILININPGAAEQLMKPVVLHPNELNAIRRFIDPEGYVTYKRDDTITEYMLFKIDTLPKSYQEFIGSGTRISTKYYINESEYIITPSVSIIDNIKLNKDYYYTFRSRDVHNHVSSLTNIYHVKLVGNKDGRFIPVINVITPEELENRTLEYREKTKALKRFLMIKPAMQQEIIDTEKSEFDNKSSRMDVPLQEYVLGVVDNYLWGKQFRARIRSKQTGRVFDLIFKFVNKDYEV